MREGSGARPEVIGKTYCPTKKSVLKKLLKTRKKALQMRVSPSLPPRFIFFFFGGGGGGGGAPSPFFDLSKSVCNFGKHKELN